MPTHSPECFKLLIVTLVERNTPDNAVDGHLNINAVYGFSSEQRNICGQVTLNCGGPLDQVGDARISFQVKQTLNDAKK
jgi:hypothetical protein